MENADIIGLLEAERRKLRITRTEFAKRLNINPGTYSDLINGKVGIGDRVKDKIKKYGLQIDIDQQGEKSIGNVGDKASIKYNSMEYNNGKNYKQLLEQKDEIIRQKDAVITELNKIIDILQKRK